MQIRTPAALVLALAVAGASFGAEALDSKVAKMEAERTAAMMPRSSGEKMSGM